MKMKQAHAFRQVPVSFRIPLRNASRRAFYSMTIMSCSVSTLSFALTLISFTVPLAGA